MILLRVFENTGQGGNYIDLPPGEYPRLDQPSQGQFQDRLASWMLIDGDNPPGGQGVNIPPAFDVPYKPTPYGDYEDLVEHPERARITFYDFRDFNAGEEGRAVWRQTKIRNDAVPKEQNKDIASIKWSLVPMPPDRAAALSARRAQEQLDDVNQKAAADQDAALQREYAQAQADLAAANREAQRQQIQKQRDEIQRKIAELKGQGTGAGAGPVLSKTYELVAEFGGRIVPAGTRGASYSVVDTPGEGTGLAGAPGAWDSATGGQSPAAWGLPVKLLASDGMRARPVANSWMARKFGPGWASSLK